ncbi:hypothetical protein [Cytophaga sp. FL35]|uniref:hypothetical protein n=1 Tax=Cytophaga sp. FL35 TaxID=1904456 RepID=UPI001653A354|nr:hypothetical protein [Cytophaga sp. FL35]MBC6997247.1 hypothetical protein [Cytophaga sp. FL35]
MKNIALLVLTIIAFNATLSSQDNRHEEPMGTENIAYKWGKLALDATALDTDRFAG